ncbi:hypothetical protein B0H10DRAFT_2226580 [Mycena sp. CBHHK59/15]|nr:hypothetical protein B0H10DRAFT_2226580 [Mycena sp. CBHHK59/15]
MRSLQASVMIFGLSSTAAIGARAHDVQDGGGDATSDEEGWVIIFLRKAQSTTTMLGIPRDEVEVMIADE